MESRKNLAVSLPFFFWGGSPKRIFGYSSDVAIFDGVTSVERLLQSSDPDYTDLLRSGERSWIDVPFKTGETRLFVTSMLFEEAGFRPEWHYLALAYGKEDWKVIGSHRRLWVALEKLTQTGWKLFYRKDNSNIELPLAAELDASSHKETLPKVLFLSKFEASQRLEMGGIFSDAKSFADEKIAWNPASLYGEWTCIVMTKKRSVLKNEVFFFPWEKHRIQNEGAKTKKTTSPAKKEIKFPYRKKYLFFIVFLVLCCIGVLSFSFFMEDIPVKSLPLEERDFQSLKSL